MFIYLNLAVKMTMSVYFIECNEEFIKIGCAKNIKTRLSGLQVSNPYPLKIIKQIDGGRDVERKLHNYFLSLKVRGEWFKKETDLIDFINQSTQDVVEKLSKKIDCDAYPTSISKNYIISKLQREKENLLSKLQERQEKIIQLEDKLDKHIPYTMKKYVRPCPVDRETYIRFRDCCRRNKKDISGTIIDLMKRHIKEQTSIVPVAKLMSYKSMIK